MSRFSSLTAMVVLVVSFAAIPASSALEIRVLGESKIVADVTAAGTVAQVSGLLTDDLDRPLPQRELLLYIDRAESGGRVVETNLLTGGRGEFRFQEELPPGEYVVHAIFKASESFEGSAVTEAVRLTPAPFDVRVVAPTWVAGRDVPVMIHAQGRAGAVGVQGVGIVTVNGRRAGEMKFEPSGRGSFDIGPFVEPGANDVIVTIPGSAHRDAARASATVRASFDVEFEADVELRIERLSRGVAIFGRVRDSVGPVEGARVQGALRPVELADPDAEPNELSGSTVTDEDGEFLVFFDSTKVEDGIWEGGAVLVPPVGDSIQREAGRVERNTAVQRAIFDVLGFLVVILGVLALASGLFDRVRRALADARRERARRAEERAVLQAEETIVPVFLDPGDAAESPVRPTSTSIGGVAWDVWQDEPIANAEIVVRRPSGEVFETKTDQRGWFGFESVPHGTCVLEASAEGFMPGAMECSIPHDGRLGRFRLEMVAVPLKVRRLYQTVVARDPRGGDYWGRLSPAEIEEAVADVFAAQPEDSDLERLRRRVVQVLAGADGSFDADETVAALTRMVEESYFSGRTYDERVFFIARDLALRLREIAAKTALALLFTGTLVAAALAPKTATAQPLDDYDPANTEWNGLSDFMALGDALGSPIEAKSELNWDEVDPSDPLIFVYPSQAIDVDSFARFVVEGGRVVIADDFGRTENLLERLEITRVAPSPGNLPHENYVGGNPALPELTPRGRHPLLPGVNRIVANHPSVVSNIGGPVVAYDAGGGLVYDMNLGRGKVIVVSDASIFINQMLGAGDNSAFARNAITYACDDPLSCRPQLFTKQFTETGSYGIGSDDAQITDGVESFNEALSRALEQIPAREFLYWVSLLIAIGLGAYLVTVFPLRGTRRYSAYVTDFIGSIPEPQAEFDWNLSRFSTGARTMNYALPMAILKEHFEELFLSAFELWPSKASERPGIERLAQMYAERYGKGRTPAEREKMEDEALTLLTTFAQLPPRNRVFLEDDARFRDVDMLKCHRRAMSILEKMDLNDEYERRTRRTR